MKFFKDSFLICFMHFFIFITNMTKVYESNGKQIMLFMHYNSQGIIYPSRRGCSSPVKLFDTPTPSSL